MATNVQGTAAREHPLQLVHYMRKSVAFDTPSIATGVPMPAYLPAGAEILWAAVKIKETFDGSASMSVGTNANDYNDIVASAEIDEGTAQATVSFTGADLTISADTLPYVKITHSNGSQGQATVIIAYVVNNDQ